MLDFIEYVDADASIEPSRFHDPYVVPLEVRVGYDKASGLLIASKSFLQLELRGQHSLF